MNYGSFKSLKYISEYKSTFIFGTGSLLINIKIAQLATFVNSSNRQQGYKVNEVNKLISTMLTGWNANGNKPKSMSDNYLELILSCDNGFVVKKRLQFPHIIYQSGDSSQYEIADIYKPFIIDNWLKDDDFVTPDITLVIEPNNEIIANKLNPTDPTITELSGRFYLYYRNLPVGINRIHIDFHIKTQTEPIDFDLEIADGTPFVNGMNINNKNISLNNVKDLFLFTNSEGNFEDITIYNLQELYSYSLTLISENKITHDLFFYPYV